MERRKEEGLILWILASIDKENKHKGGTNGSDWAI